MLSPMPTCSEKILVYLLYIILKDLQNSPQGSIKIASLFLHVGKEQKTISIFMTVLVSLLMKSQIRTSGVEGWLARWWTPAIV